MPQAQTMPVDAVAPPTAAAAPVPFEDEASRSLSSKLDAVSLDLSASAAGGHDLAAKADDRMASLDLQCEIADEERVPHVQEAMAKLGLRLRPLAKQDFDNGYLETLSGLTVVGDISEYMFNERFDWLKAHNDMYRMVVVEELSTGRVVASGTVLIEFKFIHQCSKAGHIEDIVVHPDMRGKKLGKMVIDQLSEIAFKNGCYKVILCCMDINQPFYEKCGYHRKGVEMELRAPVPPVQE